TYGFYSVATDKVGNVQAVPSGAQASVTIDKALLTITADSKTKVYGSPTPALTASYNGLVNGDTPAVVSGLTLSTTATAASGVSTYAITASVASAANYSISYVAGSLTVTPAPLTITANDVTMIQGEAFPTFTVSGSGFVNGEGLGVL